ncbi:MAG: glycosyltransferase family 39 protein [Proteobacteria bacterium]|nr:glycosyltransferase family 39 protein [Pseudomonadota bacterium]
MSQKNERLFFGAFIVALTTVRIWFASHIELAPDEAYYWQWSNTLSLTYLDHPPLIAWLIRLGTSLFGHNLLGVRFCSLLIGTIGIVVVYEIGRAIQLSNRHAMASAMLATLLPMPGVGTIVATPDTPLSLCWMFAILALIRLVGSGSRTSWYVLGAAAGVGLLAKLTALLIPITVLLGFATIPKLRNDLRSSAPWKALLLALCIALPYLIAEIAAGFPTALFQAAHVTDKTVDPSWFLNPIPILERLAGLIGGQLGLLTPLVAGWTVVFLIRLKSHPQRIVLAMGFLVPVVAACISTLSTHPEQNWASLGHPMAALGTMLAISLRYPNPPPANYRHRYRWIIATLATAFLVTAIIHIHAIFPFLPLPPTRDPVSRLHGWGGLAALSEQVSSADAVLCDNYGLAAQVGWHFRNEKVVVRSADRGGQIPAGTWLLLDDQNDWRNRRIVANCEGIRHLGRHVLKRADRRPVRTLSIAEGIGCYRTP